MFNDEKEFESIKILVDKAGHTLMTKKRTIAVAESVTAGNIQAAFSLAENAVRFFQGGITAYNLGQKCRHLHVEPTDALKHNCVTRKVADQMALQVCHLFCADYGIGITGYASPVPEENIKKLFAYISIAKNNKLVFAKRIRAQMSEPAKVQLFYTQQSIKMLISILNN